MGRTEDGGAPVRSHTDQTKRGRAVGDERQTLFENRGGGRAGRVGGADVLLYERIVERPEEV